MTDNGTRNRHLALLNYEIMAQRRINRLRRYAEKIGVEIGGLLEDLVYSSHEFVADELGVPADNTLDYKQEGLDPDNWPEGCYCRDWLYGRFHDAVDGEISAEQYYEEIVSEATPDVNPPAMSIEIIQTGRGPYVQEDPEDESPMFPDALLFDVTLTNAKGQTEIWKIAMPEERMSWEIYKSPQDRLSANAELVYAISDRLAGVGW